MNAPTSLGIYYHCDSLIRQDAERQTQKILRMCVQFRFLTSILLCMWSDNETIEDLIGFEVHAELLKEVVSDTSLLPITIGVFGDWGNGKTSIMKMLEKKLSSDEDVAVLYFDAWLFEGYDDAKSALISSIISQLVEHRRFPEKVKAQAANLLKRVNVMRLMKMGWDHVALPAILAYASGGATAVPSLFSSLKTMLGTGKQAGAESEEESPLKSDSLANMVKEDSAETSEPDVRSFRNDFSKLLEASKFKTLIVLIDDLDRCSPDRLVENLEAIKLFLNVPRTAFILGADHRIVRHAIAVRYRDALEAAKSHALTADKESASEQLIRDYLEKLVQIPYHLPRLSPSEIETYLTLLFAKRDLKPAEFQTCLTKCREARAANRFRSFGLGDIKAAMGSADIPAELKSALSFTAGAASLITEHLKGNPRQVKRFLNSFVLRRKLAKVAAMEHLNEAVLLKLMLLEYSNEARFKDVAKWHLEQKATPKQIQEMEGDKNWPDGWDSLSLRSWISMEPHLSSFDLSDYLWLARDKLASSLVGLSLVPPAIRKAIDSLLSEVGRKNCGPLLKAFQQSEADSLAELLVRHIQRDAKNAEGYHAVLECARHRPELLSIFLKAMQSLPPKELPAFLVPKLELLAQQQPSTAVLIGEFLEYLKGTDGKAGKAAALNRKK